MHGLINKAIQSFLRDTYGAARWVAITVEARLGFDSFEPMQTYDIALTEATIAAAMRVLCRPRDALLEDLGTYIASHSSTRQVRRLLRFGGVDFKDFLHSLDEMRDRGALALPELELPDMALTEEDAVRFTLRCTSPLPGAGHVILGLLRAIADDYGALVMLDHRGIQDSAEVIAIELLESGFFLAQPFNLSVGRG